MGTHYYLVSACTAKFSLLFLLQVLLDFVLVHLLSQVAWLPAIGIGR